jgi:hypothetical protein
MSERDGNNNGHQASGTSDRVGLDRSTLREDVGAYAPNDNSLSKRGHRFQDQERPLSPSEFDLSDSNDEDYTAHGDRTRRSRDLLLETDIRASTASRNAIDGEDADATKEKPIAWRSLPRKDQLFVLTLARLSEPLTQSSLGSYLFYQLQSFDPSLPDSTIAYQAGVVNAAFPFAQFLTAMLWGRFADAEWGGRKRAISLGLLGTMCATIGFGFTRSFPMAVVFRCLGGVLNGNIGVMRTMISEIIKEKKFQSRAFLLLPMTFNIGVIVGPILGKEVPKSPPVTTS